MGKKYVIEMEDTMFHKTGKSGAETYLWRAKGFNSLVFDRTGIGKLTPYNSPDLERVKADAYLKGLNDGQGVILESTQNNAFNNGYKKYLEDMEHDKGKENSIGYKIGYKKGYIDGLNRISDYEDKIRKEAYEKGFKDAAYNCEETCTLVAKARTEGYNEGQKAGERHGMKLAWEAARKIIHMPEGDLLNVFTECYSAVCTALQVFLKYDASECIEKIQAYEKRKEEQIQVGDEVEMKCGVSPAIYIQGTNGSDEIYLLFNDGSCGIHCRDEIGCKTGRHFPEIAEVLERMRGETGEGEHGREAVHQSDN